MTDISVIITNEPNQCLTIVRKSDELIVEIKKMIAIFVTLVLFFNFGGLACVPTGSMKPTLQIGSLLLYRYAPAKELAYDDIVLFFPSADLEEPVKNGLEAYTLSRFEKEVTYVKRVIGLPGDILEMKDGYVYRNGEKLDPDYIAEPMVTNDKTYEVPEGYIFCMGDNRNDSYDSRYIGAIPFENFYGKVIAVF